MTKVTVLLGKKYQQLKTSICILASKKVVCLDDNIEMVVENKVVVVS